MVVKFKNRLGKDVMVIIDNYLIHGEVVDTYGGDYTYKYVWCEVENDQYVFYVQYTGAKEEPMYVEEDRTEIAEYMSMLLGRIENERQKLISLGYELSDDRSFSVQ